MANIGGMQRVATELYEAFAQHSEVTLFQELLRSSWRWTHVWTPLFLGKLLFSLPDLIREQEIETVLFSSMVTASIAPYLTRRLQKADVSLAAISHGRDVTLPVGLYQGYLPYVFRSLDLVLPVSTATATACQERGLPSSRCCVIPNGVDVSRFDRARADIPDPLTTTDNEIVLCSVGRQVERKGFVWFVREVMPALPTHIHYYLAGNGPQHDRIVEAAREQRVHSRVHLLGKIPEEELIGLYHSSDLFIMPNIPIQGDMEGFGIVMLEAGICGVPTIASRLEGIQDVITEGHNGHLVEARNSNGFVERICHYTHHPGELQKAADRASHFTREKFAWPSIVDQYVRVLNRFRQESL
jgi:phosphatidylinositol alpha-1,6-mannosyltransferase